MQAALLGQAAQVALEAAHAPDQAPAVHLELRLARSPGADAAGLLGQGQAPTPQARQAVAQLGQLDLGLALLGGGVLGEDVQDHRGAVDGRAAQELLQVARLGRGQLVVEDHGVGVHRVGQVAQLLGLPLTDIGGRVGTVTSLQYPGGLVGPGRVHQQRQLVEVALGLVLALGRDGHPDEDDLLPEGAFDEAHRRTRQVAMCTLGPASVTVPSRSQLDRRGPARLMHGHGPADPAPVVKGGRGGAGAGPAGPGLAHAPLPHPHGHRVGARTEGHELHVEAGRIGRLQRRAQGRHVHGGGVGPEDDQVRVAHVDEQLPVADVAAVGLAAHLRRPHGHAVPRSSPRQVPRRIVTSRRPAGVITPKGTPAGTQPASRAAWARQRMPLPLISASLPSAFHS